MPREYKLAEDTIDEDDLKDLIDWLETNPWLTQNELVREFEETWADWLGTEHATFVNSGSSANLLMYYALECSDRLKNDKVVVPAVSWSTTVAPAIQLGFEPIMCDANPQTFGLDLDQLESLLEEHDPAAVITVHVLGVPNKMDRLMELKDEHGFVLMEDTCAATGSRYRGEHVGTFGELSTFSFFFGHHLSTIEGGMVCTDDEELRDLLIQLRAHGWGKDLPREKEAKLAEERDVTEFNRPFTFYQPGFNVRSSDLNARIGLSQMEKVEHVVKRRIENDSIYRERFSEAEHFHCQSNPDGTTCSIAFAALASSPEHRARVAEVLDENNIETRPLGGGNMSRQPFWTDRYGAQTFPVADRIHETSIQLPNHPSLSTEDVEFICDTVLDVEPKA